MRPYLLRRVIDSSAAYEDNVQCISALFLVMMDEGALLMAADQHFCVIAK